MWELSVDEIKDIFKTIVELIEDKTYPARRTITDYALKLIKPEYRKERVPVIGIKVDVESKSYCKNNQVVTDAIARGFFNKKLGEFTTTLSRNKDQLTMLVNGSYIGRSVNKIVKCQLVGTEIAN